jgi:thiamine-phosphate pyrophosphorylase
MKVIVVSHTDAVKNEAAIINALFEEGLELFHLRKPDFEEKELVELLQKINSEHHSKIVLHHHHQLAEQFGVTRIHFPENERLKKDETEFIKLKQNGFRLSTSVHDHIALDQISGAFDYVFFGPVYESISKPGYKPMVSESVLEKNKKVKVIAIGGVTPDKMGELKERNFDGLALLGSVWCDTSNSLKIFRQCNQGISI